MHLDISCIWIHLGVKVFEKPLWYIKYIYQFLSTQMPLRPLLGWFSGDIHCSSAKPGLHWNTHPFRWISNYILVHFSEIDKMDYYNNWVTYLYISRIVINCSLSAIMKKEPISWQIITNNSDDRSLWFGACYKL